MKVSKKCYVCCEDKSLDDFHLHSKSADGHQYRCKECAKQLAREWYRANKERSAKKVLAWQAANPEIVRETKRRHKVRTAYGLGWDEYLALVNERGDNCWICGKQEANRSYLSVDHCHETGKVRGLLCDRCNNGIARFKDDPKRIREAISYLADNSSTRVA
jgi:hypothetical protein